jgi:small subunit ribosomal protein S18
MMKKSRSKPKFRPVPTNCPFCKSKTIPSYKDYANLAKFLSDRSKILGKARTGVCAKHQRLLGREMKRARQLGLLAL